MDKFKKGDKVWFEIEGKQNFGYIVRVWKVRYCDEYIAKVAIIPNGPWVWQMGTHNFTREA